MKANLLSTFSLDSLRLTEVPDPTPRADEVLIRVAEAGVNPVDYYTVAGMRNVSPMPHIPGVEVAGVVERVGEGVMGLSPGDRVIVYPRVFDGTCDLCIAGHEHLCRNGGIWGVITNGGWAEYAIAREANVMKVPDKVDWDLAASLTVSALTPFHAILEAGVTPGDVVVVVGASGNTGQFAVQLAKLMGVRVLAITSKWWVKDLGADEVSSASQALEALKRMTGGKLADLVIDSIGRRTLPTSMKLLDRRGKLVTFGALTGEAMSGSLVDIYSRELRIIGTTGGTRRELSRLLELASRGLLKVRVWRRMGLPEARQALTLLFSRQRDGRIMLKA
ncbi:MAG: alcohol dehydrogenase catalytic domain-containing protein [Acidilobus sp.]